MTVADIGAAAILTINRYMEEHGSRPRQLYFGPEELKIFSRDTEEGDGPLNFYGIPILPMQTPGVAAHCKSAP